MNSNKNRIQSITLPVSGVTVRYRRPQQSKATLALSIKRAFPRPNAPVTEVVVMGQKEKVVNYSHPDYVKALASWSSDMELRNNEMLLKLAIVPPEDLAAQVAWVREMFPEVTEGQASLEVWLDYVVCQDDEDFFALSKAVREAQGATEEQVQEAQTTF